MSIPGVSVEASEDILSATCGKQSDSQPNNRTCETNKPEPRLRKRQLQGPGGFECVFVEEPPKQVQTECAICLCVLRDPYLVDCCCNSFCQSCIKPLQDDDKPCPLCNTKFTTCIPEKRLQRTLNDMSVYCPQKELGCDWIGKLISLPGHIKIDVNDDSQQQLLQGCPFAFLECTFCGDIIQRNNLKEHKMHACPQRPYSCEYCENYDSTYEDVTTIHWPVCPSRPMPCPNQCGCSLKFASLEEHFEKECPLQVIACVFQYAGCCEKLPRQDMSDHLTQSLALHMSLQATSYQQEFEKLKHQVSDLKLQLDKATELQKRSDAEIITLKAENQLLQKKLEQDCKIRVASVKQELVKGQQQRLRSHLDTLRGDIKRAQNETKRDMDERLKQIEKGVSVTHESICNHVGLVPFTFIVPDFKQKMDAKSTWCSPSFYTHSHGYKMYLKVYANGWADGENSHIGVALYMMRGEYDECLKWPFRGNVTIQLLNQNNQHHAMTLSVNPIAGSDVLNRVTVGKKSPSGYGFDQFIHHRDLSSYLNDNYLRFRIQNAKIKP
jgi:hypothetical protein